MTHSFKLKADAFFEKVLTFWENLGNARNRNKWIWQPTWQQWNFPLNYSVNLECWVALFISISLLGCFVVVGPQKNVSHKGKRVWLFYALRVLWGGWLKDFTSSHEKLNRDRQIVSEMIFSGHTFFCVSTIFPIQQKKNIGSSCM